MKEYYPEIPMTHDVDLFTANPVCATHLLNPEVMGDVNVVEEFLEAFPLY